ncbi:MAG: extracellular solute-binding protein [Clostridia bacterium]|nr:extracellular solute-binding protein [Clostridia bacterium]
MKRIITVILAFLLLFTACQKDSKKTSGRSDWKPPEAEPEEEWTGPTVTVAYAEKPDSTVQSILSKFKEEAGIKAISLDYSEYNTAFDPQAGHDKLALDLATGTVKPDLIITPGPQTQEAIAAVEKHLYQDLIPYLEADDLVSSENLFGAVRELYTADDGSVWGITNQFNVETILGNNALLGKYAGQTGWTLDDLLDLAESLPDDVVLIPSLTQEIVPHIILGKYGYSAFFDRNTETCSFDSPTFVRYLNFLCSLPATYDELKAQSPFDDASAEEKYAYYYNNKVALRNWDYYDISQLTANASAFGTEDYTALGYPDSMDYAFTISTDWSFLIGSEAGNPDAAWKIIRAVFEPKKTVDTGRSFWSGEIPALKSVFELSVQQNLNEIYFTYFSGGGGKVKKDPDHPFTEADLDKPGYVYEFTEEDAARFREQFDSRNVRRIADRIPSEVEAIVTEEISALLGGKSTPETCASKIQSRASIWLAEHE